MFKCVHPMAPQKLLRHQLLGVQDFGSEQPTRDREAFDESTSFRKRLAVWEAERGTCRGPQGRIAEANSRDGTLGRNTEAKVLEVKKVTKRTDILGGLSTALESRWLEEPLDLPAQDSSHPSRCWHLPPTHPCQMPGTMVLSLSALGAATESQ